MNFQLEGKHVLIAGGSRGIGYACAMAFLEEGSAVTILGRDSKTLQEAVHVLNDKFPGHVFGEVCDVSDHSSFVNCFSLLFSVPDVLVNCAGSAKKVVTRFLSPADWLQAVDNKLKPYLNTMDLFLKSAAVRGHGTVVNVIGIGGKIPAKNHLPGSAMNAALMSATVAYANEYASSGLRVNGVNPALTYTDRAMELLEFESVSYGKSYDESAVQAKSVFPMGEFICKETIANTVVFLASRASHSINGSIFTIDGARSPLI